MNGIVSDERWSFGSKTFAEDDLMAKETHLETLAF
jgi:hypothetical protein